MRIDTDRIDEFSHIMGRGALDAEDIALLIKALAEEVRSEPLLTDSSFQSEALARLETSQQQLSNCSQLLGAVSSAISLLPEYVTDLEKRHISAIQRLDDYLTEGVGEINTEQRNE